MALIEVEGRSGITEIESHADSCPNCMFSVAPRPVFSHFIAGKSHFDSCLEIAYKCTRNKCKKLFIGVFKQRFSNGGVTGPFKHRISLPIPVKKAEIVEEVRKISPSFTEVYEQSYQAEQYDLMEVAGVGYRKALEFLVKDYCILNNSEAEDNIKSLQLAKVIGQYVEDVNVKECAKRATWIGNDETHYVRKWESNTNSYN